MSVPINRIDLFDRLFPTNSIKGFAENEAITADSLNERIKDLRTNLNSLENALAAQAISQDDSIVLRDYLLASSGIVFSQSYEFQNAEELDTSRFQIGFDEVGNFLNMNRTYIKLPAFNVGSSIDQDSYTFFIFRNGRLIRPNVYRLVYVQGGLIAYIPETDVGTTFPVKLDLVIEKKFNIASNVFKNTATNSNSSVNYNFIINNIQDYGLDKYSSEYFYLFIKKNGTQFYKPVPKNKVSFLKNSNGTRYSVTYACPIGSVNAGDSFLVLDTTRYYRLDINNTNYTVSEDRTYRLPMIDSNNEPLPFVNAEDLEIFNNGYKLIPNQDYYIEWNIDNSNVPELIIRGIFDTSTLRLNIVGNVPFSPLSSILVYQNNLLNQTKLISTENYPKFNIQFLKSTGTIFSNRLFNTSNTNKKIYANLGVSDNKIQSKFDVQYTVKFCLTDSGIELVKSLKDNITYTEEILKSIKTDQEIKQDFSNRNDVELLPISESQTIYTYSSGDGGVPVRAFLPVGVSPTSDAFSGFRSLDTNDFRRLKQVVTVNGFVLDFRDNSQTPLNVADFRPLSTNVLNNTNITPFVVDFRN